MFDQPPALALDPETVARNLAKSIIDAVSSGNPGTLIPCPAYLSPPQAVPLVEYLEDLFAGTSTRSIATDLLKLWSAALTSSDVAIRLSAMALASELAQHHVSVHLDAALRSA